MRKRKAIIDYQAKPESQLVAFATNVVTGVTTSKYFTDGAARVAQLKLNIEALEQFYKDHPNPTREQTAEKNLLVAKVRTGLSDIAQEANRLFAGVNEPALLSTNLDMTAETQHRKSLEAPTDVVLSDGKPGGLTGKCKRPEGALMLFWLYTTDPTLPDEEWYCYVGGTEVELPHLPSGAIGYVKVAGCASGIEMEDYVYSGISQRRTQ